MFEFKLPSLGADMDKGTLLRWQVTPGQQVHKGDVVAVVDTTKAAVDVEIWSDGTVQDLLVEIGREIPVGTPMLALLAPGEEARTEAAPMSEGTAAASTAAASEGVPVVARSAMARMVPVPPALENRLTRQKVSPAARQRAAALGIDVSGLHGTGAQGAVTLQDVAHAGALSRAPSAVSPDAEKPGLRGPSTVAVVPVDRQAEMRRAIASAMGRSKREIPHYYLSETIPMRRALEWLRKANQQRAVTERLLPAALLLKAVGLATRDFPEMNGWFVDGAFQPSAVTHIGVAIALRQGGLIAPALRDVAHRELETVMLELLDLVRRCRAGGLRSSEMSDSTITVTNLGDRGVEQVFGVIYPPQVALVGFGSVTDRPWVEDGSLILMPVVTASLSADHRVSDGHRGARFLARLAALLQQPDKL